MELDETILKLLERHPGSTLDWVHTRLVKDGIRRRFPLYYKFVSMQALRRMETEGFVYCENTTHWFVNG